MIYLRWKLSYEIDHVFTYIYFRETTYLSLRLKRNWLLCVTLQTVDQTKIEYWVNKASYSGTLIWGKSPCLIKYLLLTITKVWVCDIPELSVNRSVTNAMQKSSHTHYTILKQHWKLKFVFAFKSLN
jgi:hypothetical protein